MRAVRFLLTLPHVVILLVLGHQVAESQTLRGSRASVDRIHRHAVNHGLHFYDTSAAVKRAAAEGRLVRLTGNADYRLVGVSHPYVLPPTELFVERLASQYRAACGERLVVTSAMRPRSFRLANSSTKSVHPTGMAIDLRKPARASCLRWLRRTLLSLEAAGVLEAVEERNPPHFHVALFPDPYQRYVLERSGGSVRLAVAPARPARTERASPVSRVNYRVRPGDTLWSIARRHGTSVEELKRANRLSSTRIVANQVLEIPLAR
jgi:LysM repeat protein